MKNDALITIKDLLVKRGDKDVLRVEQLSIKRGEVLAVVGPNGAGKSTLLLTLARLLSPEQGEISFNGTQAQNESDTVYRRRIALVMQDPLLFDTSVFENVASGLRFRAKNKIEIQEKVSLWLERLGVSHLAKRRAKRLSGGEAQRVSLARALVLEPELLLLDEPFSALDPPTRASILDDLGVLLEETETTTLFVTHDLPEAVKLADRMAVVIENRLEQIGEASSLFESPANKEVARFLNHKSV
ncbi:MAG: ATP-binding cassette domain-containing protein [Chloroflexi bacterium]|nr:ATP-binding cassette domain-containing protein [Chloroflexota bacterium]